MPDLSGPGGGGFIEPERCGGAEGQGLFLSLVDRANDPFKGPGWGWRELGVDDRGVPGLVPGYLYRAGVSGVHDDDFAVPFTDPDQFAHQSVRDGVAGMLKGDQGHVRRNLTGLETCRHRCLRDRMQPRAFKDAEHVLGDLQRARCTREFTSSTNSSHAASSAKERCSGSRLFSFGTMSAFGDLDPVLRGRVGRRTRLQRGRVMPGERHDLVLPDGYPRDIT